MSPLKNRQWGHYKNKIEIIIENQYFPSVPTFKHTSGDTGDTGDTSFYAGRRIAFLSPLKRRASCERNREKYRRVIRSGIKGFMWTCMVMVGNFFQGSISYILSGSFKFSLWLYFSLCFMLVSSSGCWIRKIRRRDRAFNLDFPSCCFCDFVANNFSFRKRKIPHSLRF